jgi:hypothetical protein
MGEAINLEFDVVEVYTIYEDTISWEEVDEHSDEVDRIVFTADPYDSGEPQYHTIGGPFRSVDDIETAIIELIEKGSP